MARLAPSFRNLTLAAQPIGRVGFQSHRIQSVRRRRRSTRSIWSRTLASVTHHEEGARANGSRPSERYIVIVIIVLVKNRRRRLIAKRTFSVTA